MNTMEYQLPVNNVDLYKVDTEKYLSFIIKQVAEKISWVEKVGEKDKDLCMLICVRKF